MQGSNYLVLCALYKVHRILSSRDERSQQEPNKKTTTTTNICTTSRTVQHKRCHSILACDVDRSGQQWHYLANNNFITAYESMNAHTHTYHSVSDNLHGSQTIIPIIIILPKHQSQRIKIKKPSSSVKFTSTWVWLGFNIHISRWEARNMLW